MTEVEHLLSKTLTKMEQELTTTQGKQAKELQHLKEHLNVLQSQQSIQSKQLQSLSNAYENLLPLLEKLNSMLGKS